MPYTPKPLPPPGSINTLQQALERELKTIAEESYNNKTVQYVTQNVAPTKPREGMTAYADGTNWNPGYGEGLYVFNGSAWVPLGGATTVLSTTAAASGTQVNFASINQTYDDLLFDFVFLSHDNGAVQNLELRLSTDNASTFETCNANTFNDAATINTNGSTIPLLAATIAAARIVHGRLTIPRYTQGEFRCITGQLFQTDGAGAGAGACFNIQTPAVNIDYVRFQWTAGNFDHASGSIRMTGIKHG